MTAHGKAEITNRRQLYDYLQAIMYSNYSKYRNEKRLDYEGSQVKTYLLESDVQRIFGEIPDSFIKKAFCMLSTNLGVSEYRQTDEPGFYHIRVGGNSVGFDFFLDTITDARFWLGFSTGKSRFLDDWLQKVVISNRLLDTAWLWPRFLENLQQTGKPRGFGLDYDNRVFNRDDESMSYLKMQLWGGANTQRLYEMLRNNEEFGSRIVLSKVRFKKEEENSDVFSIQDIKFNGKCTVRGTSWDSHLSTLMNLRRDYAKQIQNIEAKNRILMERTHDNWLKLEGYPVHIYNLNEKFPLRVIANNMFEGSEPFKLLGMFNQITDDYIDVDVVDLHTGDTFHLEAYPDLISIYLGRETCGNTLARFTINLMHSLNINLKVEADNGEELFGE